MANLKTSMPKADSLAKIADYLDCSLDFLMGRSESSNNIISPQKEQLTEQEKKLLSAYRQNPTMQEAVNKLLGIEEQPMRAIRIARSNNSKVEEVYMDFSDVINAPETDEDL